MPFPPDTRKVVAGGALLVALVALGYVADAIDERNDIRAHAVAITAGDPARGKRMFGEYGCGSCHSLAGVPKASGLVGPPLDNVGIRTVIAGRLANTPENMQRWIRDPQAVAPGTAMPDVGVGERDARDITAFLYTRVK